MAYIKGVDAYGKVHWFTSRNTWGLPEHAHNFSRHEAKLNKQEILLRNLYLDREDRIEPSIEESVA